MAAPPLPHRRNPNVAIHRPEQLRRRTEIPPSESLPAATRPPFPNSSTASMPPAAPITARSSPSNNSRPKSPPHPARSPTRQSPQIPHPKPLHLKLASFRHSPPQPHRLRRRRFPARVRSL